MTTTNTTAKYAGLARNGFTGTQEDRELAFYQSNGATSNSLADAENQFLVAKGFTTGTVDDKWTAYLVSLGYTGSKDDMINLWWNARFPSSLVNMDFTTGTLDSRVTFTRSSSATYFNSSGVLTSATTNTPRFNYDPITLTPKGLLLEESRANLLLRSDDFSSASWSKTRSSISSNVGTAPDGTTTADKLVEDSSASTSHLTSQVVTTVANQQYVLSVFAKADDRSQIILQTGNVSNWVAEVQVGFNLSTGAMFNVGFGTTAGTITPIGNGWYRCSITATMKSTGTSGSLNIWLASGGTGTYTGNGTSGVYIWGAQIEAGSFITSYVPTVASQVTRAVDNASITGTNFSSWFKTTEGTFVVECTPNTLATLQPIFMVRNAANTYFIRSYYQTTGRVQFQTVENGSLILNTSPANNTTITQVGKTAVTYGSTSETCCLNGGSVSTNSGTTATTINAEYVLLGSVPGIGSGAFTGTFQTLVFYPNKLSDANIKGLTT